MKMLRHMVGFALLLAAGQGSAAVINGSFESGLSGWSTVGDVSTSSAWATDGTYSALLTPSVAVGDAEALMGLAAGTLDAITDNGTMGTTAPTNAAVLYQSIGVGAGDQLLFDYRFVDAERVNGWNDTAIALFQNGLLSAYFLGSSLTTDTVEGSGLFSASLTGVSMLAFITFNQGDVATSPDLYIDNVRIEAAGMVVPVPAAVWLFLSGITALAGAARRQPVTG